MRGIIIECLRDVKKNNVTALLFFPMICFTAIRHIMAGKDYL